MRELQNDEPCNGKGKSHQKGGSSTLLLVFRLSTRQGREDASNGA